jgi:hypothetical protein
MVGGGEPMLANRLLIAKGVVHTVDDVRHRGYYCRSQGLQTGSC